MKLIDSRDDGRPPRRCKNTEAGMIPEDWVCLTINQIAANRPNAIVGGPFGSDLVSKDYVPTGVPVIRGQNMGHMYVSGEFVFVSKPKAKLLSANSAHANDIIFTQRGTLGQVALVPKEPFDEYIVSQSQMKLTLNLATASAKYVYHYFSSDDGQKQVLDSAIQTGVPHTNLGILRSYKVPAPSDLAEQEAIAEALSDADALIESLEQLLTKKRHVKQGAMQELISGKNRLQKFANGNLVRTLIGWVPHDWQIEELGHISDIKTGPFGSSLHEHDYVENGIPIITVEHLGEHGVTYQNLPRVNDADCKRLSAYRLAVGDVVFSRVGSIDRNAHISNHEAGWLFSGRLLRVRANSRAVDTKFLSYVFHSEKFKQRVRAVAVGQTMPCLNTQILKKLMVALPSLPEQTAIAQILSDMDAELTALEAKLVKARHIKQGMMQQLLTGKIRLV